MQWLEEIPDWVLYLLLFVLLVFFVAIYFKDRIIDFFNAFPSFGKVGQVLVKGL